jgi:hypothetical protein
MVTGLSTVLKLLDLLKSSSSCTYIHYPYTRDYVVEILTAFKDTGEVLVKVELDSEKHKDLLEYIREKCEELEE